MVQNSITQGTNITSRLSLKPLVQVLNQMIAENKPGAKKFYGPLLTAIETNPALKDSIKDADLLRREPEIIEMLLATLFPPSNLETESIYAIAYPLNLDIIYASPEFQSLFLLKEGTTIKVPSADSETNFNSTLINLAYNIILRKCYAYKAPYTTSVIYQHQDAETSLPRYLEMKMNAQYVDVECINKELSFPDHISSFNSLTNEEKQETLPLEEFIFEGIAIIDVEDVTDREVISEIKSTLLGLNAFSDISVYKNLQSHIQTLVGLNQLQIGITPFFKLNNYYLFSDIYISNSLLFKNEKAMIQKEWISEYCQEFFKDYNQPVFFEKLMGKDASDEFLQFYYEQGIHSLLICPLKIDNELLGLLEIGSHETDQLKLSHVAKIESAIPLFTLALEKSMENLEMQIDRKIKESFTAVQSAVEWKFTEAAFHYIQQKQYNENAKIPPITFPDVFPLYAAIDIRSSSEERSQAIQKDLLEQLTLARQVVQNVKSESFQLLKEVEFKINKFLTLTPEKRINEDEMVIHDFLQEDVYSIFSNIEKNMPEMKEHIDVYMKALDPDRRMVYHHRKSYEDTVTIINDTLEKFIENEQDSVQKVFPHYFEHYLTDGIEFNIYIGQSLAPHMKFDDIYVRNLKLWQLTVLAKAAKLTHAMEKKLPLQLQTTQLILSHASPISISFRSKERKFDVDGAYNIRYEIIKKRIDKVHLRSHKERLTQPGTIAIVYSTPKEKSEFLEFFEVLQNEGLLLDGVEEMELEDLPGVSSLNALRVRVNLPQSTNPRTEHKTVGSEA